jgi:CRISPR-associated protein Cst2
MSEGTLVPVHSLAISARLVLDMHSLNNEGVEGNQQQTRMVHILDGEGKRRVVNAISGDMLKHILVEHLTPLAQQAGEAVCPPAARLNPDRILVDQQFKDWVKTNKGGNSEILSYMLRNCAVTDMAGTLYAERAVARKSCVEFGWVVGLPDQTVTEQYFHVKYDPESREKGAGGESVEGRQAIFHRPASSGIYALVCNLDLYRVGLNDITREHVVDAQARRRRARALVGALASTLVKLSGAQRNAQNPHVLDASGVIAASPTALPAPAMSPLKDGYEAQVEELAGSLGQLTGGTISTWRFGTLSEGVARLVELAGSLEPA